MLRAPREFRPFFEPVHNGAGTGAISAFRLIGVFPYGEGERLICRFICAIAECAMMCGVLYRSEFEWCADACG